MFIVKPFMYVEHISHNRPAGAMFISTVKDSQVFHKDGSMWFLDNVKPVSKGLKGLWNKLVNLIS